MQKFILLCRVVLLGAMEGHDVLSSGAAIKNSSVKNAWRGVLFHYGPAGIIKGDDLTVRKSGSRVVSERVMLCHFGK